MSLNIHTVVGSLGGLALGLLAVVAAVPAGAEVLENARTRVEIGPCGELVSLVNRRTGHDWAGGGSLWRMFFDSKRGTHEEREIPVRGSEQDVTVRKEGSSIVISADSVKVRGEMLKMRVKLTISLEADGLVRFASDIRNDEPHTCIRELQYPLLTDCRLPDGAELLTTFLGGERFRDPIGKIAREGNEPPYSGRTWEFRQIDYRYPSHAVANCFAFLNAKEGLYLASHDRTFQDTWHLLRTLPERPMSFTRLETGLGKFPSIVCGESYANDANVLYPYVGDWHVTADTYRKWANTWWRKRAVPAWVKEMTGWQRLIFRHQYGVTYYTPQDVPGKVWEAGHKAGVDTLLCFGWWNAGMDNGYPDSYFETDPATGGDAAWKKAIGDFRAKGGRFHLYFNGKLIDLESEYFRKGPGKEVCYRDNTGAVFTEQYRFKGTGVFTGFYNTRTFTPANQRSEEWRAMLRKMADRAIDFGADSVFFDQLGYCEPTAAWTVGGEFPRPDQTIIAEKAKTLSMLHDYLDTHAPVDFALGTECFVDCCAQHVDYVHNLINPSKSTDFSDWARYAFPEVVVTDREIRDDTDVEWRVNHNLLLGLRTDGETFRCQRTLDAAPRHQKRLGQINALRRKYPVLMGTYRDTVGLENDNPTTLLARVFSDGDSLAVVACTDKDKSASGVLRVKGWTLASWDGIDHPDVRVSDGRVALVLPKNALVVLSFRRSATDAASFKPQAISGPLTLARPFSDGCILQRDRPVAVWGTAGAGERVKVSFADAAVTTTADDRGCWRVTLPVMDASFEPRVLKAESPSGVAEAKDVLVGEVWLVSGQSNSACPFWNTLAPRFRGGTKAGLIVQYVDKPFVRFSDKPGVWKRMNRRNLVKTTTIEGRGRPPCDGSFSELGTYFALKLHDVLGVPVGMIGAYINGSPIEPWIPPTGMHWKSQLAGWVPYTFRGVLWNQGNANAKNAFEYDRLLMELYTGWSKAFENEGMSFYFQEQSHGDGTAFELRLAQQRFAKACPHAALSGGCDLTMLGDVHGNDKEMMARRLLAHALRRDYGFTEIENESPTLRSVVRGTNDEVVVTFDHAKSLYIYNDSPKDLSTRFELAGDDGKWYEANVEFAPLKNWSADGLILSSNLTVRSQSVANPKRIRYMHHGLANLFNEVCLPVLSFDSEVK